MSHVSTPRSQSRDALHHRKGEMRKKTEETEHRERALRGVGKPDDSGEGRPQGGGEASRSSGKDFPRR